MFFRGNRPNAALEPLQAGSTGKIRGRLGKGYIILRAPAFLRSTLEKENHHIEATTSRRFTHHHRLTKPTGQYRSHGAPTQVVPGKRRPPCPRLPASPPLTPTPAVPRGRLRVARLRHLWLRPRCHRPGHRLPVLQDQVRRQPRCDVGFHPPPQPLVPP